MHKLLKEQEAKRKREERDFVVSIYNRTTKIEEKVKSQQATFYWRICVS